MDELNCKKELLDELDSRMNHYLDVKKHYEESREVYKLARKDMNISELDMFNAMNHYKCIQEDMLKTAFNLEEFLRRTLNELFTFTEKDK